MTTVCFEGREHPIRDGQTVLEALLAGGEPIPNGCRAGACGACMLRVAEGQVPDAAQVGVKDTWRAKGCFFACLCRPAGRLVVEPLGEGMRARASIASRQALSASVARVLVRLEATLDIFPGQYITLHRAGVARSYSVAALHPNSTLELHVRRTPGGALSPYLCDEASPGDALEVQGPLGDCVYVPGRPEQTLILACTGTGLAPLWGVLTEALKAGHRGPIYLFHGSLDPTGLYLVDELTALARKHENLTYVPTVLRGAAQGMVEGALDAVVLAHGPKPFGARVFLAGAPDILPVLRKKLFLAGASLRDIAMDAFVTTPA